MGGATDGPRIARDAALNLYFTTIHVMLDCDRLLSRCSEASSNATHNSKRSLNEPTTSCVHGARLRITFYLYSALRPCATLASKAPIMMQTSQASAVSATAAAEEAGATQSRARPTGSLSPTAASDSLPVG